MKAIPGFNAKGRRFNTDKLLPKSRGNRPTLIHFYQVNSDNFIMTRNNNLRFSKFRIRKDCKYYSSMNLYVIGTKITPEILKTLDEVL